MKDGEKLKYALSHSLIDFDIRFKNIKILQKEIMQRNILEYLIIISFESIHMI